MTIIRGWTSVDATVRGSRPFRFVDTHLESFDNSAEYPSVRAQQAAELVEPGGPATGKLPVILVGDLNSDTKTEVQPGDGQAYRVLTRAGFRERSTSKPLGCCIEGSEDLKSGSKSDFNHKVDHIMTNAPKQVKLISSAVTGRTMNNGYWDSDHAGLFSSLDILPLGLQRSRSARRAPARRPPFRACHAKSDLPYCHLDFLGLNNETPGGKRKSGKDDRDRPRHDQFLRRRDGGRRADRARERRGRAHDPVRGRLHRER